MVLEDSQVRLHFRIPLHSTQKGYDDELINLQLTKKSDWEII